MFERNTRRNQISSIKMVQLAPLSVSASLQTVNKQQKALSLLIFVVGIASTDAISDIESDNSLSTVIWVLR